MFGLRAIGFGAAAAIRIIGEMVVGWYLGAAGLIPRDIGKLGHVGIIGGRAIGVNLSLIMEIT
jgi:hypothetical protein